MVVALATPLLKAVKDAVLVKRLAIEVKRHDAG